MFKKIKHWVLSIVAGSLALLVVIFSFRSKRNLEGAKEDVKRAEGFDDQEKRKEFELIGQAKAHEEISKSREDKAKGHEDRLAEIEKEIQ